MNEYVDNYPDDGTVIDTITVRTIIDPDGQLHTTVTTDDDVSLLAAIGALEAAKWILWNDDGANDE